MRVIITFHGPFRIATGTGRPGLDAVVDRDELVPATSLKGLMRNSAGELLPDLPQVVEAVFGSPRHACPWSWEGARFPDAQPPVVSTRARVALDGTTGAARRDHLMFGEEVWAKTAEFTVSRIGPLPRTDGPPLTVEDHLTVLACAAAGVHSLGGGRRRGLGWVACAPADPPLDEATVERFMNLTAQWRDHQRA
ncbi:RAMP superfamily CRISPR-associated protein [Streptomyces sp. NBC_00102]|uniref:RAMP superfamily CRISPR-associated protein n=1 Tax=Streptomyces sp. NBC_00102 TaxID=2975652 RepID=UPI00225B68F0|nr:RAMP superfamily CRISPR-associated protein [Streptomyces sp. NBC_00102]MCX5400805.1 hypothetical protein [Streptomyces sp. NBC_00102]